MSDYSIYKTSTGEILRTGECPEDDIDNQIHTTDESVYYGHIDQRTHKIDTSTLLPVEKTEEEQAEYNFQLLDAQALPVFTDINSITDIELNARISSFYYGQVDVDVWKIDNYAVLRKASYPQLAEKADAEVKIASGIEALIAEGELQLESYNEDCLNVKTRFPKE